MVIPRFNPGERLSAAKLQQLGDTGTYLSLLTAAAANPDLGIGGIANGTWWINGQQVTVWFSIVFGSSADAGNGEYFIALPPGYPPASSMPANCGVGVFNVQDSSTGGERVAIASLDPNHTHIRMRMPDNQAKLTQGVPWTWASGDRLAGFVSYLTDFQGGAPEEVDLNFPIHQPWPIDTFIVPTVSVGSGGSEYVVRSGANSEPDFYAALSAMNSGGGNVIRFASGQHNGVYRVRGGKKPTGSPAPNGVFGNHNTITSDPGAVITGVGDTTTPALDVSAADHWNIIGNTVFGADFSGIRYQYSSGASGSPNLAVGNTIIDCDHYGMKARGWFDDAAASSSYIDFIGNYVDGGTHVSGTPEFREGIYCGSGNAEWEDDTNHINIQKNWITRAQADSIEMKPGTDHYLIEDNLIWESAIVAGSGGTSIPTGHITLHYANSAEPGGDTAKTGVVRRNRLYSLSNDSGTTRPPILVGRGGIEVYSNIVWGCESATAVHVETGSGGMGTGTVTIDGNTSDGTVVNNVAGYGSVTTGNNVPDDVAASFAGPVTGSADQGQGPGSGFALADSQGTGTAPGRNDATDTAPNSPPDPGALAVV